MIGIIFLLHPIQSVRIVSAKFLSCTLCISKIHSTQQFKTLYRKSEADNMFCQHFDAFICMIVVPIITRNDRIAHDRHHSLVMACQAISNRIINCFGTIDPARHKKPLPPTRNVARWVLLKIL